MGKKTEDELMVNMMVQQTVLTWLLEDYLTRMGDPLRALDNAQHAVATTRLKMVDPQTGRSAPLGETNQEVIRQRAFDWLESYRSRLKERAANKPH